MAPWDNNVKKALEDSKKAALASKEAAIDALVKAGIMKPNGELEEIYKDLCIPPSQG